MNFHSISGPDIHPPVWTPKRLDKFSAWWGHVPFAFWITAVCKPRVLVELGTHYGVSYAAFCEAILRLRLATRSYAVDSWTGDHQTGFYADGVFSELAAFNHDNYSAFSELLRMSFDEANERFTDGTIDILHVDGYHTYEAVAHDFNLWLPKLSNRGVVLFHDTNVRRDDFGVWRFFEELSKTTPCFEFLHGYGLGIACVGAEAPEVVQELCRLDNDAVAAVREKFSQLGAVWLSANGALREGQSRLERVHELERELAEKTQAVGRLEARLDERRHELEAASEQISRAEAESRAAVAQAEERARALVEQAEERARALVEQAEERARALVEREAADAERKAAEAKREAVEQISRLNEDRDFLARNLSRTYHRPLRALRHHLTFNSLRSLSVVTAPFSEKMASRFGRSAQKRNPSRFDPYLFGRTDPAPTIALAPASPENPSSTEPATEQPPALFDANFYRERNSDVANAGVDPYWHFVHYGWREGRDPNEFFDASWYMERNKDVQRAAIDPLKHYIEQGWKEGRDPGPKFSVKNYLDRYQDVRDAGAEPLEHYMRYGRSEGRLIGESYGDWITKYDKIDDKRRVLIVNQVARLALQPKFSIVMPVYNTDLRWLREAIESVRAQLYPNWQICISDDASTLPGVKELLREYVAKDKRIRAVFRETNGHISANSNSALSVATGDFIVLMDADDLIPVDALYWVAEEINAHPDVDLIYSDEDKVDIEGRRYDPYFKPDWNPALMLSQNVFSHMGVYRHSLVQKVDGFRLGFDGSQDHDLVLRCADATEAAKIRHIPHILYHWRATTESTASSPEAKPYVWNAGARAIEDHLARNGIKGQVTRTQGMFYQVSYDPPSECPKVSIVMPSGCKLELLRPCLSGLLERTTYPNFEVLLTVNEIRFQNEEQAACLGEFAKDPRVRILVYKDRDFNFSWIINWAAKQASGSVLCLMNDDIEIITADWLEKLVARLQLNRVGAVGVMLYYPNDSIQHAGVILGIHNVAGHAFRGLARGSAGYFSRARLEQDLSCVTAACLAVRRESFEDLNGFDERLEIAFNDVDFCIRLREKGWRIIWTPEVEHYHLESQTLGHHGSNERALAFQKEIRMMRDQWGTILDSDPFYNPNLSLQDDKMALAFPPRSAKSVAAT